jgi:hypothetical protein
MKIKSQELTDQTPIAEYPFLGWTAKVDERFAQRSPSDHVHPS